MDSNLWFQAEDLTAQDIIKESRDRIIKELGPEFETWKFLELVDHILDRMYVAKKVTKGDQ